MSNPPLANRVDIVPSLDDLLPEVCSSYNLGPLRSYTFLPDGYQELNIRVTTARGDFVVKIFSKEKSLKRIQDNVWGYLTFRKQGVPMPVLRKTPSNEYLFAVQGKRRTSYLCVMEYFDGNYLQPNEATDEDILRLTEYMATIHRNTRRIGRYYDTMGIANLLSQYKKFRRYLQSELLELVEPVVKEFSQLQLSKPPHSVIHGTFEPENILKDRDGRLCLLDLGCMDYHASIVDIATFLANFTIDLSLDKKRNTTNIFLQTYQITRPLSSTEFTALPVLVRSQYAVYIIRTNYYRVKLKDTTEQTSRLFSMGRRGLQQWVNLNAL